MNNNLYPQGALLVTHGNRPVAPVGTPISSLLPGQIGIYKDGSGLAVDGSTKYDKLHIYVGHDSNKNLTGSVLEGLYRHAGQFVETCLKPQVNVRCYTPAQSEIWDVTNFDVCCNMTYTIKTTVKSDSLFPLYGNLGRIKSFTALAKCCESPCATCGDTPETPDCHLLVKELVAQINSDTDKFFTASYIDVTAPAAPVVINEAAMLLLACDKIGIRISATPEQLEAYCCVQTKYFKLRNYTMEVTLNDSVKCISAATQIQKLAYEQNSGKDIKTLENSLSFSYSPGESWNFYSTFNGLPKCRHSVVDETKNYTLFSITHYDRANDVADWFNNKLETIIAIPCADTVTANSLIAVLDALYVGCSQEAHTTYVATCNCATVPTSVSEIDDTTNDGIGDN